MATTSAGNPYVESSDLVANYPATSLALANRLDKYAVNPFTNATERDAAIPTPVQGQLAQTLDDNKVWRYDGTAWAPFSGAVGAANFTDTATGTYTDGGVDYKYITYTGTGTVTFDVAGFADVLLVGSGGGGASAVGSTRSGGGGGGGQVLASNVFVTATTHVVSIGAGGAGGIIATDYNLIRGRIGLIASLGDTYFSTGGGGGGPNGRDGGNGSSGGGGGDNYGVGGSAYSSATGFSGATGDTVGAAGGGGGSGSAGSVSTGGVGLSSSLNNTPTVYGAGGNSTTPPSSGAANTGNGGDGCNGTSAAANGGSGIVIIRVVV